MPEPTALAALPDTPVIKVLKRQADCNQTSVISKLSSGCSCLPIDTSTTTSTSTLYTVWILLLPLCIDPDSHRPDCFPASPMRADQLLRPLLQVQLPYPNRNFGTRQRLGQALHLHHQLALARLARTTRFLPTRFPHNRPYLGRIAACSPLAQSAWAWVSTEPLSRFRAHIPLSMEVPSRSQAPYPRSMARRSLFLMSLRRSLALSSPSTAQRSRLVGKAQLRPLLSRSRSSLRRPTPLRSQL